MLLLEPDAPRYTIRAANSAYCKLVCRDPGALPGLGLFDVFPDTPDDIKADGVRNLKKSLAQVVLDIKMQQLHTFRYDSSNPGCDPLKPHYWEIVNTPVLDEAGNIGCIIHSVKDIGRSMVPGQTDEIRQRDEEVARQINLINEEKAAAAETTTLLQAVIDTAQAGIFMFTPVYDADGEITDFRFRIANRMLSAYVGQAPEAVTGALGSKWFPGYRINGLFERYRHTAVTGEMSRFEFHYNNDGINVWLDIMSTKVGADVLVTFTDHTSLKNLQRRLEEHVEELRLSNTNLEQFAYIASHDLQEPLRKIKSFGDMLQNRYEVKLGPEGADLIDRMQSAANRMSTLIEDLLTYSRVSVKPVVMKTLETDKVLDGVLFDLERLIQQKAAVITADKLAPVAGQATQIGQLFQNLLSNALKFHHPSRPPEIRISSRMVTGRESGFLLLSDEAEKPFQLIRFEDNGIGFETAYRERIFQIFQRLHNRNEYPGTGVGLSIVKKVVENHNGYIEADSAPGKGATFSILLPAVIQRERRT